MIQAKLIGEQRIQIDRWPLGEGFKAMHIVSFVGMCLWTAKPTATQIADGLEAMAKQIRKDHA